jgi:hypothetical protein
MHEMRCKRFREGWATADDPIIKDFLLSWGNDNMKGKSCKQEKKKERIRMEKVKMMLSHDKQHFVNTRKKKNTTINIMEREIGGRCH